jgi:hypothetical protein
MLKNTTFLTVWILTVLAASPKAYKFGPSESSGAQSSDQYFYCRLVDAPENKRTFFTLVFPGNNSIQRTYETQFSAWVAGRYRGVVGTASCSFDKGRHAAIARREDEIIAEGRENRAVIETNWRP